MATGPRPPQNILEYLSARQGLGPVEVRGPYAVSVLTTDTVIVTGNGSRIGLYIMVSAFRAVNVFVPPQIGSNATFLLNPGGGGVYMHADEDMILPSLAWSGDSPLGTATVMVMEMLLR